MKKNAKSFLRLLQKHNVKLDDQGDPDFSQVQNPNVLSELKKKESLVRVTLMQADMEFEYP